MKTLNFRGCEVEDRSGIDEDAEYRCMHADCGKVMSGRQLLPIIHRPLMEVDGKVVKDMSVPLRCNIRRCSYCRGTVALVAVAS
jgi:hypothetical protein